MSKKLNLKAIGPILILMLPAVILFSIFLDSHYNTNVGEYEPEGEVIYSMSNPERYGLAEDEAP